MALLKCKMCGGDLEIIEGSTVCICEYCGTKQTVPTLDNEKKIALFTRANRLRLGSEFDKAYSIYESILIDYPEEAEAYWGLVLCKYGIEYVDDPKTATKVPTCHRSSFESIFDDSNFELAIEYADATARAVYREEAKAIEEIRKGIIEISSHEEPYDIFICYKETDEGGSRTIDSVIAQDVYDALVSKGYRVFFARITLEDKLGKEYEPYIFSALHSSKVMLVFGTDYEYFNAVWVKNEWSRFLKLIETDKEKALIPCYKDIDAYDMPKEFRKLQAQDMGKVGAIQDLLRGIGKILSNKKQAVNKEVENTATTPTADIFAPFLKKAKQQLKNGKFEEAKTSYQKVLEFAPTLEEALVGSFLSAQKVSSLEKLEAETSFFNTSNEYLLLCESASDELNAKLSEVLEKIKQNNISALDGAMHSKRFDDARTYIENLKSYDSDSVNEEELYFLIDVKASSFEELENGTVAFYDNKIYKGAAGDFKARLDDALNKIEGNIKKAKLESVLSENNVTRVCDLPDSYLVKNCKRLDWIYEAISEEEAQALRERILSLTTNNKKKKPLAIIAVLIVVALAVIIAIVVGVSAILISRLNNNGDTSTDTENTDTGSTETDSTDTDSSGNEGGENEGGNDSSDSNTGNEGDNAGNEGAGDNNTGVGGEGIGNEDPTTLIIPEGTVSIKNGEYANNTTITKVVIPSSVKTIDASAFSGCTSLESVTIPNGVTSIADEAFEGCTNLTSLEIPSSVTEIGNFAFKDCASLTIIVIPDSVTSVGDYAFRGCINVTNIVIPGETTVIGQNAFDGCSKVESAIVPSTAISYVPKETLKTVVINAGTSIEDEAFKDCISLTTVEIPNSVTSIGESAFSGCVSLATIKIPNNVESIGNEAFANCTHLTNIEIPSTVQTIGNSAFNNCVALESIEIPENASIGEYAFEDCTGITNIVIPSSVVSIGQNAFDGCISIKNATMPASAIAHIPQDSLETVVINGGTTLADYAFQGCECLNSIVISNNVSNIGAYAFEGCVNMESAVMPNNLIRIGTGAFSKCFSLLSLEIPNSITSIGSGAFYACSSLEYNEYDNALYLGNEENPYLYLIKAKHARVTSCKVHENTMLIYGDAFDDCSTNLTSIEIPNDKINIDEYAFFDCSRIEYANIPTTAIEYIQKGALKSVVINSGASIPESAFSYCTTLQEVVLSESVTNISYDAFLGCELLEFNTYDNARYLGVGDNPYHFLVRSTGPEITSCEINENTKIICAGAFGGCIDLAEINIPDGVTHLCESAFAGCADVANVQIPESVVSIADYAFAYCSSLSSIEILNGSVRIGVNAFCDCQNIQNVTMPTMAIEYVSKTSLKTVVINGGTSIPSEAFRGCKNLISVVLDEGITTIESYAFANCENLQTVEFPDTLVNIENSAFEWCYALTNVVLKEGLRSIGFSAFSKCTSLKTVVIPSTIETQDGYMVFYDSSIESLTAPASIATQIANRISIGTVRINAGTRIEDGAFQYSSFSSISIANTVTYIGESAFANCENLESIVIPDSVTNLGAGAFSNCFNLTSVTIGNGITSLEPGTFAFCEMLENVTLGDKIESIGISAFMWCKALTKIVIPAKVSTIANSAFESCSYVTIYCEAESMPSGWDSNWNPENRPVVWGYTGE